MFEANKAPQGLIVDVLATEQNFLEADYLAANPDVAEAVAAGAISNGFSHFENHGRHKGRKLRLSSAVDVLRAIKMKRIEAILRPDMGYIMKGLKYDFLTDDAVRDSGISHTEAVSANNYDGYVEALIRDFADGLILDCGAGKRPVYYSNVINYEIVDYDTTDVIGIGERLPFMDNALDAVISVAVLEHVRDPFRCAAEITRVLKPNGRLICCVPFLQPEHGYPHHYYNMAPQGLRALFERSMVIDDHKVIQSISPIWSLMWIIRSWAAGLQGRSLDDFTDLTMRTFMARDPLELLEAPWVKELSEQKNFELASATMLFAHKPVT